MCGSHTTCPCAWLREKRHFWSPRTWQLSVHYPGDSSYSIWAAVRVSGSASSPHWERTLVLKTLACDGPGTLTLVLPTPSLEAGYHLPLSRYNLRIFWSYGLAKSQMPPTAIIWHLTSDALDVNISSQTKVYSSTLLSLPNWMAVAN